MRVCENHYGRGLIYYNFISAYIGHEFFGGLGEELGDFYKYNHVCFICLSKSTLLTNSTNFPNINKEKLEPRLLVWTMTYDSGSWPWPCRVCQSCQPSLDVKAKGRLLFLPRAACPPSEDPTRGWTAAPCFAHCIPSCPCGVISRWGLIRVSPLCHSPRWPHGHSYPWTAVWLLLINSSGSVN